MQAPPQLLLLENVVGFESSQTRGIMAARLAACGFTLQVLLAERLNSRKAASLPKENCCWVRCYVLCSCVVTLMPSACLWSVSVAFAYQEVDCAAGVCAYPAADWRAILPSTLLCPGSTRRCSCPSATLLLFPVLGPRSQSARAALTQAPGTGPTCSSM